MAVDTKHATDRRELTFKSIDEIVADAREIVSKPHRTVGNWSAGQILMHLARTFDASVDGVDFKPPLFVRLAARLMKKRVIRNRMSPGFKLPPKAAEYYIPGETDTRAGLKALTDAVDRFQTSDHVAPHAFFGPMTRDEWAQLHQRHSELHLSFIVPE